MPVLSLFVATIMASQGRAMKADLLVTASDSWIQQPTTLQALRGKVVLLDFWDYTCVNCSRTHPYLKEWYRRYHDKGLEIISIHTPEFAFAKDSSNVRSATKREGFSWHVLNDPKKLNWYQFGIFAWPQRLLLDPHGAKQLNQVGEGRYGAMEKEIQYQIRTLHPGIKLPPIMKPMRASDAPGAVCGPMTPEIYTWIKGIPGGHVSFGSADIGKTAFFNYPSPKPRDQVMLSGTWTPEKHFLVSSGPGSNLELLYQAKEVNAVFTTDKAINIRVYLDGLPLAKSDFGSDVQVVDGKPTITVSTPRMYSIIKSKAWKHGDLELRVLGPGLTIYSFSFSTDCVFTTPKNRAAAHRT